MTDKENLEKAILILESLPDDYDHPHDTSFRKAVTEYWDEMVLPFLKEVKSERYRT